MMSRAHQQSVPRLEADYIATAKNVIVADLHDRPDLQRINDGEPVELWELWGHGSGII